MVSSDDKNTNEPEKTSSLSIYEWVQFMKDRLNSLEGERRFVFTQLIGSITTVVILSWFLIELFFNQKSFDIGSKNSSELKIVFLSFIVVTSFLLYRLFLFIYVVWLRGQVMRMIHLRIIELFSGNDNLFLTNVIFIILLAHRLSPWLSQVSTIPIDILKSFYYSSLLLMLGFETLAGYLILFYPRKFLKALEESVEEASERSVIFTMIIYLLIIIVVVGWILSKLEWPPDELLIIQVKFSLIIVGMLFISIYWAKPLYHRLNETAEQISHLNTLIGEVLYGKILTPQEIRDNYFKVFEKLP